MRAPSFISLALLLQRDRPASSDADPGLSTLTRWLIIGSSIAAGLLLILLLSVLLYCCLCRRAHPRSGSAASEALYYKFDDAVPAAAAPADTDPTLARHAFHPRTTSNHSSRSPRNTLAKATSYASNDDAIAAPRALQEDVPSSGVAFLDDYGRPIASPITPQR